MVIVQQTRFLKALLLNKPQEFCSHSWLLNEFKNYKCTFLLPHAFTTLYFKLTPPHIV